MNRYDRITNMDDCIAYGGEWIRGYRKKDSTLVHGFCRERKSGHTRNRRPDADIHLKYQKEVNDDKTELTAQYGNYKVHIFKDDIEPERYTWAITKNTDEDLWYDDATYSDTNTAKKEAGKILSGIIKKNDS